LFARARIRHEIVEKDTGVLIAEMWYYLEHVSTAVEPPATHPDKTTNNIYILLEDRFDPDAQTGPGGEFEGHTAISTDVDATSQDSLWACGSEYAAAGAGAAGAWTGVRVVIDLDAGVFDVYVDTGGGWAQVVQNAALDGARADPNAMDIFTLYQFSDLYFDREPSCFWGDTDTYVDDIFVSWAPPGTFGDATDDGKVDSADLAIWQQHYDPIGGSTELLHVPEPAAISLLVLGGLVLLKRRK
jgi:hypothetical protein